MQLSVSDAAKLLDTTPQRVYAWIEEGAIPFYRVSDQYRFHRAELLEWATARGLRVSVDLFRVPAGDEDSDHPLVESVRAGGIHRDIAGDDSGTVLRAIVDRLPVPDEGERDLLRQVLSGRDARQSTVGDGVAIPHVRHPIVLHGCRAAISLSFLARPIAFGASDGKPVRTVFMMVTPTPRMHLHLLSRLSAALLDKDFKAAIDARAADGAILELAARVEDTFSQPR